MTELSMLELQDAALLPAREAMQTLTNVITNVAVAVPEAAGNADADANQTVVILQAVDAD
ncbi:MAG TPA: hypothetical protein VFG87_18985 [Amycolatopsis sp.]|nr:hypothetical protein [Amycolatopsis sp.]